MNLEDGAYKFYVHQETEMMGGGRYAELYSISENIPIKLHEFIKLRTALNYSEVVYILRY